MPFVCSLRCCAEQSYVRFGSKADDLCMIDARLLQSTQRTNAKASFNVCVGPEAGSVRYACALSVPFICVRFGSFQFGRTKWHV